MMNGVLFETNNLNELYPQKKTRAKFFWEK
jgi:hypothetical protein